MAIRDALKVALYHRLTAKQAGPHRISAKHYSRAPEKHFVSISETNAGERKRNVKREIIRSKKDTWQKLTFSRGREP
jgi:hypothetical protein